MRPKGPAHRLASTSRELSSPSALASLVSVLDGADEAVVLRAARSLWDLAAQNAVNRAAIASAGGIEPLVAIMRRSTSESSQEAAAAVLWHLTVEEDLVVNASAFAAAGSTPHTALLHDPRELARLHPGETASGERRLEVAAMGGVAPL
eukprot:4861096-Prymnesium_polylepis.1